MKNSILVLLTLGCFTILACSSSKTMASGSTNLQEEIDGKNRGNVPLLTRIRQLPGVTTKNGVPVVNKAANSLGGFAGSDFGEPLYVLNNQIIGASFVRIDELVDNYNVKKVELLTGSDASFYGTQGAKGVIKITTYQ